MNTYGIVILFRESETCGFPLRMGAAHEAELSELLTEFCRLVLADPTISDCLASMHEHAAGSCAWR